MNSPRNYAKITLDGGRVEKPVLLWKDERGIRMYYVTRGRVALLKTAPGLSLVSFGERPKREPGKPRPGILPEVFSGPFPDGVERIEYLATCACTSPLKRWVPSDRDWETSDA